MNVKTIFAIVLLVFTAIFVIQNITTVEIRILFWSVSMSRSLMVIVMLLIGFIIGWITCSHLFHRHKTVSDQEQSNN
ncbi:lipopolysaccharide assembly protein LapA domain-containing protein [Kaarinaea lacus]